LLELTHVETLRKPSTGLKRVDNYEVQISRDVETLRKPSTGLKQPLPCVDHLDELLSRHSENPARD